MTKWNAIEEGTKAEVGSYIWPDGWDGYGSRLGDCDWWDKADFFVTGRHNTTAAVNITVTGRTFQRPWGFNGPKAVRVRIEFVGDGEPSSFSGAWMKIE